MSLKCFLGSFSLPQGYYYHIRRVREKGINRDKREYGPTHYPLLIESKKWKQLCWKKTPEFFPFMRLINGSYNPFQMGITTLPWWDVCTVSMILRAYVGWVFIPLVGWGPPMLNISKGRGQRSDPLVLHGGFHRAEWLLFSGHLPPVHQSS